MSDLRRVIDPAVREKRTCLTEYEAKQLLRACGAEVPDGMVAESVEEARAAADTLGYPLVMKVHSALIMHKTELGGVITGLQDRMAVAQALPKLLAIVRQKDPAGQVLIERMAPPGVEVIIGMQRDPQFGPVLMFGLGGVFTELLKDVSFRMIPVTDQDVAAMIEQIRGYRLLTGYRGLPPADLGALQQLLLKVSELSQRLPEIASIDLNPVMLHPHGATVLDALIQLS